MKNLILSSVLVLIASSAAQAQQAVQWKVSDGGNGHWYEPVEGNAMSWTVAAESAVLRGGYLATVRSPEESNFAVSLVQNPRFWRIDGIYIVGPWLGGYQDRSATGYSEPAEGWRWVDGERWLWTNWGTIAAGGAEPNNGCGGENFLHLLTQPPETGFSGKWNDAGGSCGELPKSLIIEWSADCNGDGIVDYGQILDGTFPDANGDGVPDCCDGGGSCTPCPGDVASDGMVDGVDLAAVLSQWGTQGSGTFNADIDGSGLVDGGDLGIVLGGWGPCPQ